MIASGRGADVAQAMALPVFAGMCIELVSLFVVPVLYCGYMEWKLDLGLPDERWQAADDSDANAAAAATQRLKKNVLNEVSGNGR